MTANIQEAENWIGILNEEPMRYDAEQDKDIELPKKPTNEELRSALEVTRTQVTLALTPMLQQIATMQKELDKLRNHRHDFSKTFSGRAEF